MPNKNQFLEKNFVWKNQLENSLKISVNKFPQTIFKEKKIKKNLIKKCFYYFSKNLYIQDLIKKNKCGIGELR